MAMQKNRTRAALLASVLLATAPYAAGQQATSVLAEAPVPQVAPGLKIRERSPTFADHYSQARMFWRSMTPPEQRSGEQHARV